MLGRVHLLRGDLDDAAAEFDVSITLAEGDHWLSFLPWPQALRGEVQLLRADLDGAAHLLQQAFARACQLGDPCWEGVSARSLALLAEANGQVGEAFEILADARVRTNRHPDAYTWLDGYILDAQCQLGRQYAHPDTAGWARTLRDIASRSGMRELTVRALLHEAELGVDGSAAAAALLVDDIDNGRLADLAAAR
jgi:hypothetical protein